jgi:hypothetical protein
MDPKTFFGELRRRNVHKVAIVYAVIAWLLFQIALTFLPGAEAPPWLLPAFVVLLVVGFVFILYISWAFEATPEGLKRTERVPRDAKLPTWSKRKFATFIILVVALAASLLVYDVVRSRTTPAPTPPTAQP